MSGHSKWSKVKHQKATTDVAKAKAFTKASRAITIAVREGGGITDPNGNFKLRLAIEQAKSVNMPKDTIDRAIAKAIGANGEDIVELVYEAYGPGGVALIIRAASENRQRTVAMVKSVIDKHGGVLAAQGAVLYMFHVTGVIVTHKPDKFSDPLDYALAVGADDVRYFDDVVELFAPISSLLSVRQRIEQLHIAVHAVEITYRPKLTLPQSDIVISSVENLIDVLESLDDVQQVYTNLQ